jgi:predicted O-methyltransferase YrrM
MGATHTVDAVPEKELNWKFAETLVVESAAIASARHQSIEVGIEPITPSMGAQLAVLAATGRATSIIELGTGAGVSGLWMLAGAPTAVLTTIDSEADHHQLAKSAFAAAGIPANQTRLIGGRALDVLPRMNESSYDLVFIDADAASVIEYVEHGLRLVRTGGTVVVAHALWRDRVANPAQRDDTTASFRTLIAELTASDAVVSALSPVGDGLLQITRIAD